MKKYIPAKRQGGWRDANFIRNKEKIRKIKFESYLEMQGFSYDYKKAIINYVNRYAYLLKEENWALLKDMEANRKRLHVIEALSKFYQWQDYLDDGERQRRFRAFIRDNKLWKQERKAIDRLTLDEAILRIRKIPRKHRYYLCFLLSSGLRIREANYVIRNHEDVCNGRIINLNLRRGKKNVYETYCLCRCHEWIKEGKINVPNDDKKIYERIYYTKRRLGFYLRYLRKINFTHTAMYINPILAKYIQGRMLYSIDMFHYFMPLLDDYYDKYVNYWDKIIERIIE